MPVAKLERSVLRCAAMMDRLLDAPVQQGSLTKLTLACVVVAWADKRLLQRKLQMKVHASLGKRSDSLDLSRISGSFPR